MFANSYDITVRDFLSLVKLKNTRPDLSLLTGLMQAFGRLPYENLTKIIRAREHSNIESRIRTPDIVLGDHVELGAGGTCFSLTYFFEQVLKFSGFDTYTVLCNRSYGAATHCALVARLNGEKYLVDPGYLMGAPVIIPSRGEEVCLPAGRKAGNGPSSRIRVVRLGETDQVLLFTERGGKTKLRYRFRDAPIPFETFKERWFDSFDWAMMRHPCVSQNLGGRQLYIRAGKTLPASVSDTFGIDKRIVDAANDCVAAGCK